MKHMFFLLSYFFLISGTVSAQTDSLILPQKTIACGLIRQDVFFFWGGNQLSQEAIIAEIEQLKPVTSNLDVASVISFISGGHEEFYTRTFLVLFNDEKHDLNYWTKKYTWNPTYGFEEYPIISTGSERATTN